MRMPRLLPLVAVAAGGVLAINAVENGPGIIGAARSFAEGVANKAQSAAKGDSALPADANALESAAPQVVAAKPAPVCAESPAQLARDAGLSPAELQVIQSLGARRGELDQREQGLDTQLALVQAAEAKVDAKINTLNALKGDMQTLLGQLDDKQQAEVDRLVKVYEGMKPADAAARFVLLTDDVRLPIASKMKERVLSAMIAKMPPAEAKRLTESLAARYVAQAAAAKQALSPTPVPPAQAAAAPTPAAQTPAPAPANPPPTQLAQAAPAPTPAASAAKPAKPARHRPTPARHPKPATASASPGGTPYAEGPPAAQAAAAPKSAAAPSAATSAAAAAKTATAPAKPPTPAASAAAPAKSG
jgi:flagellar motility protein MotE (MotC chaperone)